jgi:hypothetical protein
VAAGRGRIQELTVRSIKIRFELLPVRWSKGVLGERLDCRLVLSMPRAVELNSQFLERPFKEHRAHAHTRYRDVAERMGPDPVRDRCDVETPHAEAGRVDDNLLAMRPKPGQRLAQLLELSEARAQAVDPKHKRLYALVLAGAVNQVEQLPGRAHAPRTEAEARLLVDNLLAQPYLYVSLPVKRCGPPSLASDSQVPANLARATGSNCTDTGFAQAKRDPGYETQVLRVLAEECLQTQLQPVHRLGLEPDHRPERSYQVRFAEQREPVANRPHGGTERNPAKVVVQVIPGRSDGDLLHQPHQGR